MGINPVMTSSSGQMFGSPQRQALPWLPSQTFTDLVGACSYLAMAGRGRSARAQRNRSRHSNQDRDHETLKVSIRQSGDTTVTEGQQSLPASNTNRPVYSIAVKPLAVEADLTVNPHGHRPGWANDRAYRYHGDCSEGPNFCDLGELLTNQNQAVNTAEKVEIALAPGTEYQIDTQAASIEYTVNDDDATPGQVCCASLWQKPINTLICTCPPPSFSGQQDGQGRVPVLRYEVRHHHQRGGGRAGQPDLHDGRWPCRQPGGGFADTRGQQHRPRDIPQYQYQTMAGDFFRDSLTTLKLKFK